MSSCKKIAFFTLGCKVNQYETESIKNSTFKMGYKEVPFHEKADIYIVNSCTVTSIADKKTRNMLRRAKKLNSKGIVILTGCYAETNAADLKEFQEIDYIVGNKDKQSILLLLKDMEEKQIKEKNMKKEGVFLEDTYQEYEFATLREMSRAYIKIQDGCNSYCSYCKIPFARGKSRSRSLENILKEVKNVVSQGYNEIILIGINIGAYGEDLEVKVTFEEMVKEILKISEIERIRFGSIYPDRINKDFVELFKNKKILPHVHLSLQSGDDKILEMMNRRYDSNLIKNRCEILKKSTENFEFTADVIVGFPGETQEMFDNTCKTIEAIGFSELHIFQYSEREGTRAADFKNKIDEKTKKERAAKLEELKVKMKNAILEKYIGKNLQILIEENKKKNSYGHLSNYLRGEIENLTLKIGGIYSVKVKSIKDGGLICEKDY